MPTADDRFKNRRRMAWLAFAGGLLMFPLWASLTALAVETGAELVRTLVAPFYAFVGVVVTAYIGAASYEHGKAARAP